MTTVIAEDIWHILERQGYDIDSVSDEKWEDIEDFWANECEMFLKDAIEQNIKNIVTEWASKLNLKKHE